MVKFYSHPRILFSAALAHLFCVLSFWRVPSANTPPAPLRRMAVMGVLSRAQEEEALKRAKEKKKEKKEEKKAAHRHAVERRRLEGEEEEGRQKE